MNEKCQLFLFEYSNKMQPFLKKTFMNKRLLSVEKCWAIIQQLVSGGGGGGGNTPDIEVSQASVIFILEVIMIYFLSRLQTPSILSGYYSRQKHYCSLNISLTYNSRDTTRKRWYTLILIFLIKLFQHFENEYIIQWLLPSNLTWQFLHMSGAHWFKWHLPVYNNLMTKK